MNDPLLYHGVTRWTPAAPRGETKPQYELGDLIQYADADFVGFAYRALLKRVPDEMGFNHFLGHLRSGGMSKVEVLAAIRWSDEGVRHGVHVNGLLAPYLLQKWQRKRFIGPVISWLHGVARIGALSRRQQIHDAIQARESHELGRHLNVLAESLQVVSDHLNERIAEAQAETARARERIAQLEASIADFDDRLNDTEPAFAALDVRTSRLELLAPVLSELQETTSGIESHCTRLQQQHADVLASVGDLQVRVGITEAFVADAKAASEEEADRAQALDPLYAAFEDHFRGSQDLVRTRVAPYLDHVKSVGAGLPHLPVLDIGSGRGEWLELLRDQGVVGFGVDLNHVFVQGCRAKGLDVTHSDALTFLRGMADGSVGAITSMHLVEHLSFENMIELIDQCRRVLHPTGVLILETPNPENLLVGSHWFYMDPTHRNPLPPEMLRWIVESRGFSGAKIERLTHARELFAPELLQEALPGAESVNAILAHLRAPTDYAVIATRPGALP